MAGVWCTTLRSTITHTRYIQTQEMCIQANHILPHKSTIRNPPSLGTLKCLTTDAPQNNWDGTWRKHTCMHARRKMADSHLRVSDVERKHLEGRESIRKRRDKQAKTPVFAEITLTHLHKYTFIQTAFGLPWICWPVIIDFKINFCPVSFVM